MAIRDLVRCSESNRTSKQDWHEATKDLRGGRRLFSLRKSVVADRRADNRLTICVWNTVQTVVSTNRRERF